jgi:hypothetical protein
MSGNEVNTHLLQEETAKGSPGIVVRTNANSLTMMTTAAAPASTLSSLINNMSVSVL